jgi:hypothetical protein
MGLVEFELRNLQNRRFPRLNKNCDYIRFPSLLPA